MYQGKNYDVNYNSSNSGVRREARQRAKDNRDSKKQSLLSEGNSTSLPKSKKKELDAGDVIMDIIKFFS